MPLRILPRRATRSVMVLIIAGSAACTSRTPGESSTTSAGIPSSTSTSPAASPDASEPSREPTAGANGNTRNAVRIQPPRGGSILVRGTYPRLESRCRGLEQPTLEARYPGTLRARRAADGTIALTVTLPFERYLEGIAEVPPTWPAAALQAQAIAARSYALATTGWDGERGETLQEPICATTACQVYRGIPVPYVRAIGRWYRAVRQTAGEVLLYRGAPATTVYFSTSNGRTYGNDEVFGSAPLPYLQSVIERHDGASPTSRWGVRLPFGALTRFLRAAGEWPRGRAISAVRVEGGAVLASGGSVSRTIGLSELRDAVNTWAPCLEPNTYPPASRQGTALPLTVPSRWLTISVSAEDDAVVVTGRGWGHGAGMVQWGAYGKARRGASAEDILAFYYGGLRPERFATPGLIHVQVASGLTTLRVTPSGTGARIGGRQLGAGSVLIRTGGDELLVNVRSLLVDPT